MKNFNYNLRFLHLFIAIIIKTERSQTSMRKTDEFWSLKVRISYPELVL